MHGTTNIKFCKKACLTERINPHRILKKIHSETHSFRQARRKHECDIKLYPIGRGCEENVTELFLNLFQVEFDIQLSESSISCTRDDFIFKQQARVSNF